MPSLRDVFPGIPLIESPLFSAMLDELGLSDEERRIAVDLHNRGYAVIDFPDDNLDKRIERIQEFLIPRFDVDMTDPETIKNAGKVQRVQDAWVYDDDIREIATNPEILDLLGKLYGRSAFPFQTLNFPVGTQQHLHSDSIHFSSVPERFMCGVWLAMEDVHVEAGPLTYLPGSHRWPIISNSMIGRRGYGTEGEHAQLPFEKAWEALIQHSEQKQEVFLAHKGQALIWAANLLHGGSPQINPRRTRWSQVTHYYFDNCTYYTPAFSDEQFGNLDLRSVIDINSQEFRPNIYLNEPISGNKISPTKRSLKSRIKKSWRLHKGLPKDFDPDTYYRLNPDVALAKHDAAVHYLRHGKAEGRRYRLSVGKGAIGPGS